jgi:isopentenyl diphosphate isomerase/L-lactate dehydrogenase-like FMN-dependent dehydrogenase
LKKELDVAMALCGVKSIDEIGPHVLADSPLRNSVKPIKPRKRR